MRAVKGAIEVSLLRPLNIVRDHEVKFAGAIVVDPGGTGGELVRSPHARCLAHIGEGAVTVVVEKMALSQGRDEKIVEAVVIVIADCHAKSVHRKREAGFAGHIRESAVVIVVIE